ncbi:MAG: aldo/keto reductase [Desulfosarcinaceae bacterium]
MKKHASGYSRREFIKMAGGAGMGTLLGATAYGGQNAPDPSEPRRQDPIKVPTRPFGKSGAQVPILALGGMFDLAANQLMLRQAIQWGVTYWDTADCYHRGSESGIGKYLGKFPQDREKVFLVSKSDAVDPEGLDRLLARSLERMQTSYLDLYFIHGLRSIAVLNDETRRWAEKAKAEKKIRLFGFSTHSNMADCLRGAAKLDWIDGIMMTYNYRTMDSAEMNEAVEACTSAGIGLTAMKTQGSRSWFSSSGDSDLQQHFMAKGFTAEQAKLKIVWQDKRIASICSQMDSMKLLKANAEAASDDTPLSMEDIDRLRRHAIATASDYCAGCGGICETAVVGGIPVSDIMRHQMYCRSYARPEWARDYFKGVPPEKRRQMLSADYSLAERRCPHKIPVGRLVRDALESFA